MKTRSNLLHHRRALLLGVVSFILAVALYWGWSSANPGAQTPGNAGAKAATSRSEVSKVEAIVTEVKSGAEEKTEAAGPEPALVRPLTRQLRQVTDQLRRLLADTTLGAEEKKGRAMALIAGLRQALKDAPGDVASAAILEFLNSGEDSATGLGFSLQAGGSLEEAPSMRTTLLDVLGQVDPAASVEYAQRIFTQSQVPDEWALSLRNLGWQNLDGNHTEEMRRRFGELLQHDGWLSRPTGGLLEAFDTAVHLGGAAELTQMIGLVRPVDGNNRPVENGLTHAAYLALDRITGRNTTQTLETLNQDASLLAWAPEHRASLMARANVADEAQRRQIESYLASLADKPQELETFTRLFPNRNGNLGNSLISTPEPGAPADQVRALDAAALSVVNQWLASGRYTAIESQLQQISTRLNGYVNELSTTTTDGQ